MPRDPSCTSCSLYQEARTVCCWGDQRGSQAPARRVMIVGQNPGAQEDVRGVPFIGPSGEKLKDALDAVGLTDYYVTNIVKCFSNNTPSSTHIAACKGYLDEEIRVHRPEFILALGNPAWHYFGSGPITEHAGRESRSPKYDCWVMPALHPSAILRNPNLENGWRADLARFARLVRGELVDKPPVETVLATDEDSLKYILESTRNLSAFTYDFETLVMPWWHKPWKPLSIAFSWEEQGLLAYTVPLLHPESTIDPKLLRWFLSEMVPIMADPQRPKSAHNALFDDMCWYRLTGRLPFVTCDTMVLAHLLDENRLKSLKYLGRALLGWPQWDIDATKEHPLVELAAYNGYDAAATLLLRKLLLAQLQEQPRLYRYFIELEMPKIRALERMIARGAYADRVMVEQHADTAACVQHYYGLQLPVANPASTKQLTKWLYDDLKLTPPKKTPKGNPSTDEEAVKRICQRYPQHRRVRNLLGWRRMNKYRTTYFAGAEDAFRLSFDGVPHYDYRSTSVETGRLGSYFHTTPRDNFVRSIYTARPGTTLVCADYSQEEARIAAWAASGKPRQVLSDSSMLNAWFTGRDVYVETAAEILGKRPDQVTTKGGDSERQIMGKVPVLSSLYEISPAGIQRYAWKEMEIDWTTAQARRVYDGFHRRWPEFRRWHDLMRVKITNDGFAVSEIGRVRRLDAALYGDRKSRDEAVRSGINHPIQSVASDIPQMSMILLTRLPTFEQRFWLVGNVHDALMAEVEDDYLQEFLPIFQHIMLTSHLHLRPMGLCLPHGLIQVEIKVGSWGDGKEIKNIPALSI